MSTNPNTHLYLYAKWHYRTKNTMDDLRKIVAERAHMTHDSVSERDVWAVLLPLVFEEIIKSGNPRQSFSDLVLGIAHEVPTVAIPVVLDELLHVLRFVKVEELNLGEPDYSILPKANQ